MAFGSYFGFGNAPSVGIGSVWYNGTGVPSSGLGNDGDYYLDTATDDVYYKSGGTWSVIGNIKGNTGAGGTNAYYGSFSDNQDQTIANTTQAYPIIIGQRDEGNGVTIGNHNSVFTASRTNGLLDVTSVTSGTIKLGMTLTNNTNYRTALFTGSISGTTLTITSVTSGTITRGMYIIGGGINVDTQITDFISGSGGIGTYRVNNSQTIGSLSIDGYNIKIIAFNSGSGGVGTYTTSTTGNIVSGSITGTLSSKIIFANQGIYNVQFSVQFINTDSQDQNANVWLSKNGTDVSNTNGIISVPSKHGMNIDGHIIVSWNYVFSSNANDYIELYWSADNVSVSLKHDDAQINPTIPSTPAVILTATQVVFAQGSYPDLNYYKKVGTTNYGQRYYAGGVGSAYPTASASAPTENILYAVPIVISQNITITEMLINATAPSTTPQIRLGIYTDSGSNTNYPSTLVAGSDSGVLNTIMGTANIVKTGLSLSLTPNLYWLVFTTNSPSFGVQQFVSNSAMPILGYSSALAIGTQLSVAQTFGALPSTFPLGGTLANTNYWAIFIGA